MANNIAQIEKEIEKLQKQKEEMINAEKAQIIEKIKADIKSYKITAKELGFKSGKSSSATTEKVIAYQNEQGETWSGGRGRKPQWVQDIYDKYQGDETKAKKALEKFKV